MRRLGLPHVPAEQGWRVTVPDPAAAAELIRREPALFRDFELTKGRMDDVFLAVTGKKLAEVRRNDRTRCADPAQQQAVFQG